MQVEIDLKAIFDTPLNIGTGTLAESIADKPLVKDANRRPLIPGSTLKGKVRHECERIIRALKKWNCEAPYPDRMCKESKFMFSWDEVPGNDEERLKEVLAEKYYIDGVKNAKIEKIDAKIIRISTNGLSNSLKLNDERTEVEFEIDNDTIIKFIAKQENNNLNIYSGICPICQIFGSPWHPSPIIFDNLTPEIMAKAPPRNWKQLHGIRATDLRTGVGINRERGVAEDELLYSTETFNPHPALVYQGCIKGSLQERKEVALLLAGLRSVPALGSSRSRGLGWWHLEISVKLDGQSIPVDELLQEVGKW